MLSRLGETLAAYARRLTPDPFVFALLLTVAIFAIGAGVGDASPGDLVDAWAGPRGVWLLLTFSMQMCLILVTGFVVARTRAVSAAVQALASLPRGPAQATALVAIAAMAAALINWGLGLIVGALLAREVGRSMAEKGAAVHYPILAAAGYSGLAVWHGGLSGSAPLKVTLEADVIKLLGDELGAQVGAIPLSTTVGSPRNLIVTGLAALVAIVTLYVLTPREPAACSPPPAPPAPPEPSPASGDEERTLADRLGESSLVTIPVGLMGLWWCLGYYGENGIDKLDPNAVNMTLLSAGLLLCDGPRAFMRAGGEAARACAGVIVQFPLYGGIMAILGASGLMQLLAAAMPSGQVTLPLAVFLSGGALNLVIPSGGGQWAVQGPIAIQAAVEAGVDPARVVMALAWGDQWTNLLQPFWALPLLGITGLKAGDIMGYTVALAVTMGAVFALGAALPGL